MHLNTFEKYIPALALDSIKSCSGTSVNFEQKALSIVAEYIDHYSVEELDVIRSVASRLDPGPSRRKLYEALMLSEDYEHHREQGLTFAHEYFSSLSFEDDNTNDIANGIILLEYSVDRVDLMKLMNELLSKEALHQLYSKHFGGWILYEQSEIPIAAEFVQAARINERKSYLDHLWGVTHPAINQFEGASLSGCCESFKSAIVGYLEMVRPPFDQQLAARVLMQKEGDVLERLHAYLSQQDFDQISPDDNQLHEFFQQFPNSADYVTALFQPIGPNDSTQ